MSICMVHCHGITRKEIDKKIDDIIEFAELDKFMGAKLGEYSSGMIFERNLSLKNPRNGFTCSCNVTHHTTHSGNVVILQTTVLPSKLLTLRDLFASGHNPASPG